MNFNKRNDFLCVIFIFFGLLYADISLVNHYNFRTSALDLGIYNNAIYDYAHFRMNNDPLPFQQVGNLLADHFELLPMIFSPVYFIFGSYALLLIQIASILFGGYGIFLIFKNRFANPAIPGLAVIHFLTMWGIYSALASDYHNNVVGAMFVPWLFYYFDQKKFKQAAFFLILLTVSKENMALWAGFICMGFFFLNFRDKDKRRFAIVSSMAVWIYFVAVISWIMPALSQLKGQYFNSDFSALGKNFGEVFFNIIKHPEKTFTLLFENNLNDPHSYGIKAELHYVVLLSGGFALLAQPQYLLMLLPIFGQKLFNDDYLKWGINAQYSIEFAPILTIALFTWLANTFQGRKQIYLALFLTVLGIASTANTFDWPVSPRYGGDRKQFYKRQHYVKEYPVQKMHEALKMIPVSARVSAQTLLVPHLAFRKYIRLYPKIDDANYIALVDCDDIYPMSKEEYKTKKEELLQSTQWQKVYDDGGVLVLKKISE